MTDRPIDALAAMAKNLDQASKDAIERLGEALLAEASAVLPGIKMKTCTPGGARFELHFGEDRVSTGMVLTWCAKGWQLAVSEHRGHWAAVKPTAAEAVYAGIAAIGATILPPLTRPAALAGLEWRLVPIAPKEPT